MGCYCLLEMMLELLWLNILVNFYPLNLQRITLQITVILVLYKNLTAIKIFMSKTIKKIP